MQFLRKAALTVAASLLVITLSGFGFAWSVYQVFRTPHDLKQALDTSGIYRTAVIGILKEQTKQASTENAGSGELPVNRPEIQQIVQKAFPPEFLQGQTEQVIDSAYAWLSGKTPELTFSLNLGEARVKLADGLQEYTMSRLASLPVCTATDVPLGADNFDPLTTACVPPGLDKNAAAAKVRNEILSSDFLKDSTISADSLKSNNGKTLSQQLGAAPRAYQTTGLGVYGGAGLALLLGGAVIAVSATWRSGVRKVSIIAITVGSISAALGWLSSFAMHQAADKIATMQTMNTYLQPQLLRVMQSLANSLRNWWVVYGLILVLLGIAALLVVHVTAPKNTGAAAATPPKSPEPDSTADIPTIPAVINPDGRPAEPPKTRHRKIQG